MFVFGVILIRIFPHLDLIWTDTPYQSECGKIRIRIAPNTNTCHSVVCYYEVSNLFIHCSISKSYFRLFSYSEIQLFLGYLVRKPLMVASFYVYENRIASLMDETVINYQTVKILFRKK